MEFVYLHVSISSLKMIVYCVLFLGVATITWGQNEIITEWTVEQFPNPETEPEKCGGIRGRKSYLCDPNSILTSSFAELDHALNQTFMDTQCICSAYKCRDLNYRHGVHISVAVLANLKLTQGRTSALPEVEHFALQLESRHWNFGACDNDVVIVYSAGDNVIYTATGSAANYILDTQKIKDITSANGIYFRNKNPMAGLYAMIMDYRNVFRGGYQPYALYQESQNVRGLASMVTASTSCLLVAIVTYLYNKL
ncbi:uncharacterized protein LOC133185537 isoform X1 [Saccostrea echinata]|uniref:uncharacterized protein LOC133185537 isoform X1 n=2 Tax=Saccostrea echinata TaxID=191078 RepID=UPI002A7F589C|nr:uncharacterized protein LOC133185537 isoform X1 [Saccostrea echinata]